MQVAHDKGHRVIWRGCTLGLTQCHAHARTRTQATHATSGTRYTPRALEDDVGCVRSGLIAQGRQIGAATWAILECVVGR
jgi:hypothetical protein